MDADVVVVGAGLAGLTAAEDLVAAGLDVVVLEARDRVGGRTLSVALPGSEEVVEAGGQWVGPTQDRVAARLRVHGLSTYPTHDQGSHLLHWRGSLRRYRGQIPRADPATLLDVAQLQLRLDRAARRLPAGRPWDAPSAAELDAVTFAEWFGRRARTRGGRRFLHLVTQAVWSAEPEELSALWALAYVQAAGGLDPLISTRKGAQQDRVVGGSQRLSERMAAGLGERVRLGSPVRALSQDGDAVTVRTADGQHVRAAHAIVAVPPPLQAQIHVSPALPADRAALLQRMPMGQVTKVNVVYDRPWWREQGLSGQGVASDHAAAIVYDNTPASGAPGVLLAFLEGRHATAARALEPEARRALVLDALVALFGERARTPTAVLEQDWGAEEWTRGCYGAFTPPGALTSFGPALRAPVGRLHWAGAETGVRWTGYLDGAVESGERTATEVLAARAALTLAVAR